MMCVSPRPDCPTEAFFIKNRQWAELGPRPSLTNPCLQWLCLIAQLCFRKIEKAEKEKTASTGRTHPLEAFFPTGLNSFLPFYQAERGWECDSRAAIHGSLSEGRRSVLKGSYHQTSPLPHPVPTPVLCPGGQTQNATSSAGSSRIFSPRAPPGRGPCRPSRQCEEWCSSLRCFPRVGRSRNENRRQKIGRHWHCRWTLVPREGLLRWNKSAVFCTRMTFSMASVAQVGTWGLLSAYKVWVPGAEL